MGNCLPVALLVGACALQGALARIDCEAHTEAICHTHAGCRWYSYRAAGDCKLCNAVHPDKRLITGCRDWTPFYYCRRIFDEIVKIRKASHRGYLSDAEFKEAVQNYHVSQGSGEPANPRTKNWRCNLWCDVASPFACEGQPTAVEEFRGVNYGGRFVPEQYLGLKGTAELFKGVHFPKTVQGQEVKSVSLCDLGEVSNAAERLSDFLDVNIKGDHFERMAALGFNVVRLPLGYWNLIDLPGSSTPNGARPDRWRTLQSIMPAGAYRKWIDKIFNYAHGAGLRVLLDLHGAPGAQNGNAFTGCDQGKGNYYFNTAWNQKLAVRAVEEMARICQRHGAVCYGMELLNEPQYGNDEPFRVFLRGYYEEAIKAARRHVHKDMPLLVMDWTQWLPWWRDLSTFSYVEYGRVVLSTHIYDGMGVGSQSRVRDVFKSDISTIEHVFFGSKYEVIVSEYCLSGHGNGNPHQDHFDYHRLAHWLVHQLSQRSLGSAVWNYDAGNFVWSWGPVAHVNLGARRVDWAEIFGVHRSHLPKVLLASAQGELPVDPHGTPFQSSGGIAIGTTLTSLAVLVATVVCLLGWLRVSGRRELHLGRSRRRGLLLEEMEPSDAGPPPAGTQTYCSDSPMREDSLE